MVAKLSQKVLHTIFFAFAKVTTMKLKNYQLRGGKELKQILVGGVVSFLREKTRKQKWLEKIEASPEKKGKLKNIPLP